MVALAVGLLLQRPAAAETLHVYGPGGPAQAMRDAAAAFQAKTGVSVVVTADPTPQWAPKVATDADVIFSGSEAMMSDFVAQFAQDMDARTITPLFLRPVAVLVRPGNPGHIGGVNDLLRLGHRILVVTGAGQQGLWEDVVGRTGRLQDVAAFRANIAVFAKTSAEAKAAWTADPSLDAWLIWNIWQVANPKLADAAPVEPELQVWRDTATALTHRGEAQPEASRFVCFLRSSEGVAIFERWGWSPPTPVAPCASTADH